MPVTRITQELAKIDAGNPPLPLLAVAERPDHPNMAYAHALQLGDSSLFLFQSDFLLKSISSCQSGRDAFGTLFPTRFVGGDHTGVAIMS